MVPSYPVRQPNDQRPELPTCRIETTVTSDKSICCIRPFPIDAGPLKWLVLKSVGKSFDQG